MSKTHANAGQSKEFAHSPFFACSVEEITSEIATLDVNRLDSGEAAIHYACMGGNVAVARYLLENTPIDLTLTDKMVRMNVILYAVIHSF